MQIQKTLGLRYHDPEQIPAIIQCSNVPWADFTEIFTNPLWTHKSEVSGDSDMQFNDLLEVEFTGDGTWVQFGTADHVSDEPTQVHALVIEIAGLSRTQLQERFAGVAAIAHTVFAHSPAEPSWRLIVPLARSVGVTLANTVAERIYSDLLADGEIYLQTEQGVPFCRPGCLSSLENHFDHFKIDGNFVDAAAVLSGIQSWDGTPTPSIGSAPVETVALPVKPAQLTLESDTNLRSELEDIYTSSATPEDFVKVSARVLELEFELNHRQKWAPAFRPSFPIPYLKADLKPAHKLIQQARVVIDCHWLHTRCQKRQAVKEARWQALLAPTSPFPIALARDFAARAIAGQVRADEILCLTPFQQAQTRALSGKKVADARKKAEDATPAGRSPLAQSLGAINQWAASDPRLHSEKYVALARAMFVMDGNKHTNTDLGILVGLILGEAPVRENQIRAMKTRLATAIKRYS